MSIFVKSAESQVPWSSARSWRQIAWQALNAVKDGNLEPSKPSEEDEEVQYEEHCYVLL